MQNSAVYFRRRVHSHMKQLVRLCLPECGCDCVAKMQNPVVYSRRRAPSHMTQLVRLPFYLSVAVIVWQNAKFHYPVKKVCVGFRMS